MPNPLDSAASAKRTLFLDISWHTTPDGSGLRNARYTSWTDDLVSSTMAGTPTFASEPAIDVELPKEGSTISDREASIIMPIIFPFDEIEAGIPYPRNMRVRIYRLDPDDEANTLQTIWTGLIREVIPNHQGKPGLLRIRSMNLLYQLHVPIGIPADTQCGWKFGDQRTCGVNIEPFKRTVTITGIVDFQVQVTGIPTLEKQKARWKRGYLDIDGGTALIRNYNDGGDVFLVNRRLPQSLVGEQVIIVPGCSKLLTSCRFWQAEIRFGGYGYGTPAYNPTFETE